MAKSNALPIEYIQVVKEDFDEAYNSLNIPANDRLQSIHIFKTKDGMWHGTACLEKESK